MHIKFILLAFYFSFSIYSNLLKAQVSFLPNQPDFQKEFERAFDYFKIFKHDSTINILTRLEEKLEGKEHYTPLGLRIRLWRAISFEKIQDNEQAIKELLEVMVDSKKYKQWDTYAYANLSLACLNEKLERSDRCLANLKEAEETIKTHGLDSIYPRFAARISSYHRFFGDSAKAEHYAREILRTSPNFHHPWEEVDGHLLLGHLLAETDLETAIKHHQTAKELFLNMKNYTGYSWMFSNLTKHYFLRKKDTVKALIYNDSTIYASKLSLEFGHENDYTLKQALIQRGDIYKAIGEIDSAIHYFKKATDVEVFKEKRAEVIELEAQFKEEKQAMQIAEQERERYWLLGFIVIVGISLTILSYYFFQLKKANKKTKEQAIEIARTNEELAVSLEQQIILQGEIHHRVKNNLQVLIRLLELQRKDIEDPIALQSLEAMANRIYSMSAVHEILYLKQGTKAVNLLEYTQNLCNHFSVFIEEKNRPLFNIDIENKYFNLETLMPLGIILNELLTNSLKYAADLGQQLKIDIQLLSQADGYCIYFKDNGPGFPSGALEAREGGLGSYLLRSMSRQLSGHMESMNDEGAVYKVFFKEKNI